MDTATLRTTVLDLLARWRRLPLSDVIAMLSPVDRPRLRLELLEGMVEQGLISMQQYGDELVVALVEAPAGSAPSALTGTRPPASTRPPEGADGTSGTGCAGAPEAGG
jgi:hypothetical protein